MTVVETTQRFTPLGVAFWDLLTDAPITDGLVVSARPATASGRFRRGFATPGGVHALSAVPGLRDVEFPRPEPGARREFTDPPSGHGVEVDVLVEDRLGRFLPTVLRLAAPRRGVATAADALAGCTTLVTDVPQDLPMFLMSAPARSVPPSVAVVRASLRDRATGSPAGHSVVVVEAGAVRASGVADAAGNVVVAFPYPLFHGAAPPESIPAGRPGIPTDEQQWPVTVRVRWAPETLSFPLGVGVPRAHTLYCQGAASIVTDDAGPATGTMAAHLDYGRELQLATAGIADPRRSSFLYVERAR
ncbi:hypothetical protein ACI8AV_13160 [Geodermatophilus sp. SYSU D00804]